MLAGEFPPGAAWDWLDPREWNRRPRVVPEVLHASMLDALASMAPASCELIHLSNVLDWLSPHDATALLDATQRALRPSGRVVIRQLNSSLDIPALGTRLKWDTPGGREAEARDRSFFPRPTDRAGRSGEPGLKAIAIR